MSDRVKRGSASSLSRVCDGGVSAPAERPLCGFVDDLDRGWIDQPVKPGSRHDYEKVLPVLPSLRLSRENFRRWIPPRARRGSRIRARVTRRLAPRRAYIFRFITLLSITTRPRLGVTVDGFATSITCCPRCSRAAVAKKKKKKK